ncbi:FH2 domain containing 3 [Silurus asotus]|uniref:FH2 domain containing 3 n=1 Tax=Silurus asotus TaxID=30991 RepID=A0AAD5B8E3_SILAS|nr:FH2 domain containing 3 [Silurus asotus]
MDGIAMSVGPSPIPPPPPPPPPLPPPPSVPGSALISRSVHRRSKMRSFNWDTIPKHSVVGKRNVWTSNKNLEDLPLDTECIEELFSHTECVQMAPRHGTVKKNVWGLQSTTPLSEVVSILNSKKSMNLGILLKQFKRPIRDIVEDIMKGNMGFAAGRLRALNKLLPDDEEVSILNSKKSMNLGILLKQFKRPIRDIVEDIMKGNMGFAAGRLRALNKLLPDDEEVKKLLSFNGDASQLAEADRFFLMLVKVPGIQKQEVEKDINRELAKTKEAKAYASKQPDLQHQMDEFLQMAICQLADMEASLRELDSISHSVAEFFCEDPASFKLEECCSIFHSFCKKFDRAVLENAEREAVERHRRQQREKETLSRLPKRRTIAACSRQSSEHEALESILTSFLSTRPTRRRQPSSNRETETLEKNNLPTKNNLLAEKSPIALDNSVNMDKKDIDISLQERTLSVQKTLETPAKTEQNVILLNEEQAKSFSMAQETPEKVPTDARHEEKQEEECLNTEKIYCDGNVQCTPSAPKRAPCIEDKSTPKSCKATRRRSILVKQHGEVNDEQGGKEETDHTKEDSQKEPCRVRCSVSDAAQRLNLQNVSSPHHRGKQEVDLAHKNGFGSPWTVLSPNVSPSCMRRRRHSFGSIKDEDSEDGVWALPDTPSKGPLLAHMCRSYEHSLSTSVISHVGIRDSPLKGTSIPGTLLRSASVGENPESIPSFRFSAFFPRRHVRETKRHEPSTLMSFFQRFGEKGRPASIGDSYRVDS